MSIQFPFCAVTGQGNLKLALILAAINPAIGGVLISGPRGCAKSTLARGMLDILPNKENASFVDLPLGASEDRVLGSLDLQTVLNEKQVRFQPGLLAQAHNGILYVDEVNLLQDHLVDVLLDVAASGENKVERDGVSHSHPAKFLLLGTMNPDEGELRPQLQDRFGLCVELSNQFSLDQRVEVVKRREEFDCDSLSFSNKWEGTQKQLSQSIHQARSRLASITCNNEIRLEIANRCQMAHVDGLRADIVFYRAALAHCAWTGRLEVSNEDLNAVEPLVLQHRRQNPSTHSNNGLDSPRNKSSNGELPHQYLQDGFKQDSESKYEKDLNRGIKPESQNPDDSEVKSGDWGSMAPVQQSTQLVSGQWLSPFLKTRSGQSSSKQNVTEQLFGRLKGNRERGSYRTPLFSHRPDWIKTVMASPLAWPPKTIKRKPFRKGASRMHLIVLDTSASTLADQQFSKAKGLILNIAEQAYLKREQIAILGFGNDEVIELLPKIRAPKYISQKLDAIHAGGGTPLEMALFSSRKKIQEWIKEQPGLKVFSYLLTDGRVNEKTLNDIHGQTLSKETVLVDLEQSSVKRGRGQKIADVICAQYLNLNQALS